MFVSLLNMPLIKAGDTHGDTLAAENHTAFDIGFSTHMKGSDTGEFLVEIVDHAGLYTGTYQYFRTVSGIPQSQ